MSDIPSIVTLELSSIPENLTLVRGMLSGVAELLAMDAELVDDLKTAVSEAANNVVMHAYPDQPGLFKVKLYVTRDGIEVLVIDEGIGMPTETPVDDRLQGVGVPVMQALAEQAEFRTGATGGTEVRMLFPPERDGRPMYGAPVMAAPEDGWTDKLSGDALISLSPVTLLPSVLGRLARALAANARFSLDRFSDVYLVTDSIAAHAVRAATSDRMGFSLEAAPRRLQLTIGPFSVGSTDRLMSDRSGSKSPLVLLSDELDTNLDDDGSELVRVVMIDHRR